MTPLVERARGLYGAHPLHLLLVVAGFALAACTVLTLGVAELWNPDVWWQSIAVWFVGAAVVHDLVLFPAYTLVDRVIVFVTRGRRAAAGTRRTPRVPVLNFVRVPLLACGLVTLLFAPGIVGQGADSYLAATGQTQDPFLLRWALLCSGLLLAGVVAYAVAWVRHSPRGRSRAGVTPSSAAATTSATPATAPGRPPSTPPRGTAAAVTIGVVLGVAVVGAVGRVAAARRSG